MADTLYEVDFWSKKLNETFLQVKTLFLGYVPNIIAALVVLVLGWFIAKFAKFIGNKLGKVLFSLAAPLKLSSKSAQDVNKFGAVFALITQGIVLFFFILLALKVLNLPGTSEWLIQLYFLIPKLISGLTIIILGFLFGTLLKDLVHSSLSQKEGRDPSFIANITRFIVITIFIIWGVGEFGFDISILTNFMNIILACGFGAAALGFGVGSSKHVSNMIASHNIKKNFQIGENITVAEVSGVIIDITSTFLVVETPKGVVVVPARIMNEKISCKY